MDVLESKTASIYLIDYEIKIHETKFWAAGNFSTVVPQLATGSSTASSSLNASMSLTVNILCNVKIISPVMM